jgi:hypothetical protein
VVGDERSVRVIELGEHLPVGLCDVRAPLELALDDDRESGALHTAHGQEL